MAVIDLPGGSTIKLEALDPTTNAPVAGVKVNNTTISAIDLSDTAEETPPPPPSPIKGAYTTGGDTPV